MCRCGRSRRAVCWCRPRRRSSRHARAAGMFLGGGKTRMTEAKSLIALFDESVQTAEAIDELHNLGIPNEKVAVLTGVPYPELAFGRRREWLTLPTIVLAGALGGVLFGVVFVVLTPHLYRPGG